MAAAPVVHFEVVGSDAERSRAFYGELFDWTIDTDNAMGYGMVAAGDGGIAGGVGASPDAEVRVTFYVQVPDVEAALVAAERLGGKRVMSPGEPPGAGIVLGQFADPDGNIVGVIAPVG